MSSTKIESGGGSAGDVESGAARLQAHYDTLRDSRQLKPKQISPRFLLVHTVAHLLMNRLTFECGYSSASLRERLYVAPVLMPNGRIPYLHRCWRF